MVKKVSPLADMNRIDALNRQDSPTLGPKTEARTIISPALSHLRLSQPFFLTSPDIEYL